MLPSIAPEKFWEQHYYDCLEKAVEDRSKGCVLSTPAGNTVPSLHSEMQTSPVSTESASTLTGIDALLATCTHVHVRTSEQHDKHVCALPNTHQ